MRLFAGNLYKKIRIVGVKIMIKVGRLRSNYPEVEQQTVTQSNSDVTNVNITWVYRVTTVILAIKKWSTNCDANGVFDLEE